MLFLLISIHHEIQRHLENVVKSSSQKCRRDWSWSLQTRFCVWCLQQTRESRGKGTRVRQFVKRRQYQKIFRSF